MEGGIKAAVKGGFEGILQGIRDGVDIALFLRFVLAAVVPVLQGEIQHRFGVVRGEKAIDFYYIVI